jgi:hypothetical protein
MTAVLRCHGTNVARRGHPRRRPDHLDANYQRAPGQADLGSSQALSTVVRASGCTSLLLYILLYGLRTYASRQLGQTPASHARSTGVGLFVPKPSTGAVCQRRSGADLEPNVRECPLASAAVGGDCHSLRHSVACSGTNTARMRVRPVRQETARPIPCLAATPQSFLRGSRTCVSQGIPSSLVRKLNLFSLLDATRRGWLTTRQPHDVVT